MQRLKQSSGTEQNPSKGGGSLAISEVSIRPGRGRIFKYFLFSLVALSVAAATIENGLNVLVLTTLPVIAFAVLRKDYSIPFLWSERVGTILFFTYVPGAVAIMSLMPGMLSLPSFMAYFAFGLLMVRILSPLTDRNIWQVVFLTLGMILINCILTNHVVFGLLLPVYLFILMGVLLLFHLAVTDSPANESAEPPEAPKFGSSWYGNLVKSTLGVLAATIIVFVFFPRPFMVIPGLTMGLAAGTGMGQLDQKITYREMAERGASRRIAFVVEVESGKLQEFPYWRGRVLERTDGAGWYPAPDVRGMAKLVKTEGPSTVYKIIPYKLQSKNVYATGLTVRATGRGNQPLYITSEGEVLIDTPFLVSDSYRVVSVDRPTPVSRRVLPIHLDTRGVPASVRDLAVEWTKGFTSNRDKAGVLMTRLRDHARYVLQPPPAPDDANPIEYFLFQSRMGNCEHFAGALAMMLRSVNIPSRVVDGFAGAERGSENNQFIVRFSRAHAWAEAVLDDRNWTTLDATPASSLVGENVVWRTLTDLYDKLEYNWIKYVVYFDKSNQAAFFGMISQMFSETGDHLGQSKRKLQNVWLLGAICLTTASGAGLFLWLFRRKNGDISAVYVKTMQEMMRRGLLTQVSPRHEQNLDEIGTNAPECAPYVSRFTRLYLECRFGNNGAETEALLLARKDLLNVAGKK